MGMYLDRSTGWYRQRDDSDKVLEWFEMLHRRMMAIEQKLDRLADASQDKQEKMAGIGRLETEESQ